MGIQWEGPILESQSQSPVHWISSQVNFFSPEEEEEEEEEGDNLTS